MKALLQKFIRFVGISGVGWCLDFGIYILLTMVLHMEPFVANWISSFPAITLVFVVSTSKIFKKRQSRVSLKAKYLIYIAYQAVLLLCISYVCQMLSNFIQNTFSAHEVIVSSAKLLAKIIVTPITMVMNFFVMRYMTERL